MKFRNSIVIITSLLIMAPVVTSAQRVDDVTKKQCQYIVYGNGTMNYQTDIHEENFSNEGTPLYPNMQDKALFIGVQQSDHDTMQFSILAADSSYVYSRPLLTMEFTSPEDSLPFFTLFSYELF